MAGCEITAVFAGIAGGTSRVNSRGIVAVKDREVRSSDVKRVIDAAQAVAIPVDREIVQCQSRRNSSSMIRRRERSLGMSGVRLEAKVHIVTAAITSVQNIIKCCNRAGLKCS
jgi:cell division protein FtsA